MRIITIHLTFAILVLRCTNLRVLVLSYVHITPYLLDNLLYMNKLLETIFIGVTRGLNGIKVNNLRHLYVFEVCLGPDAWIDILEIHDAPSLRSLVFKTPMFMWDYPPSSFEIRTIGGILTKLRLDNVHMDDAFSNMIKSNFPFLEELTLEIKSSSGEILDITSLTLRRLMLIFSPDEEIKVQVYAPNLLTYTHLSSTVPILLFTTTPPEQIELLFSLRISIDESFFLKLREALKLSSKFNIQMIGCRFGVQTFSNV
ncbi:F-box protein-like protein [Tanacetum coccineum]